MFKVIYLLETSLNAKFTIYEVPHKLYNDLMTHYMSSLSLYVVQTLSSGHFL